MKGRKEEPMQSSKKMENYIIELIQAEIDGENSPSDSRRVQEILKKNKEARSLYKDLNEIAEKMNDLKQEIELPVGLSSYIKEEIEKRKKRKTQRSNIHNIKRKEKMPGSKMFSGRTAAILVAAAVVVIVVFVTIDFQQFQPKEVPDIVGTDRVETDGVEQAERYTGIQITDADIDLDGDEILQILQSDHFQQLAETGNLQAIAKNETFSELMLNPDFNELFADPALYKLMANPEFNELLTNPDFKELISNPAFSQLMASSDFSKYLTNPDFHQLIAKPDFN